MLFPAFDSKQPPCVEWLLSFSDRNRRVTSFSRSGLVLTPRFGSLLHCIAESEFHQGIAKNQFYKILQLYKFPQKAFHFAIGADNEA